MSIEKYRSFRVVQEERIIRASLVRRVNRFLVECRLTENAIFVKAFLPNPGRLWELFFPGTTVLLSKDGISPHRTTEYTLVGAETSSHNVIMLNTHAANGAVRWLLDNKMIPSLAETEVVRQEYPVGGSRFDFLLRNGNERTILEVKSCTLFGEKIAMFPDAPSARAVKHVKELGKIGDKGSKAAIIFLIQSPKPDYFLPDYHTDPRFAEILYENRNSVDLIPLSVSWSRDLVLARHVRELELPWHVYELESGDRGCYMLILYLRTDVKAVIGAMGEICFKRGFYIYVGSAKKNLDARIERHKRKRKKFHWHIDYLAQIAEVEIAIPIRTSGDLECDLARHICGMAEWTVEGFGSSDCNCTSHLFGMISNPLDNKAFMKILLDFRINRLEAFL